MVWKASKTATLEKSRGGAFSGGRRLRSPRNWQIVVSAETSQASIFSSTLAPSLSPSRRWIISGIISRRPSAAQSWSRVTQMVAAAAAGRQLMRRPLEAIFFFCAASATFCTRASSARARSGAILILFTFTDAIAFSLRARPPTVAQLIKTKSKEVATDLRAAGADAVAGLALQPWRTAICPRRTPPTPVRAGNEDPHGGHLQRRVFDQAFEKISPMI